MRHPLPSDRIFPKVRHNPYRAASNLGRAFQKLLDEYSQSTTGEGVSATVYRDSLFSSIVSNQQAAVIMVWRFHRENYCWTEDRYGYVIRGTRPSANPVPDPSRIPPFPQPATSIPQQVTRARRRRRSISPGYSFRSEEVQATNRVDPVELAELEEFEVEESLDSVGKTFGIELEFFYPDQFSLTTLARRLADIVNIDCRYESYNHSTRNWWKITTDASIMDPPTGWIACELVSPPLKSTEESYKIIDRVCETLETMECLVNKTCGLHVHVKVTNNLRLFKRLAKNYRNAQRAIETIMPPSRREGNCSYAKSCVQWMDITINGARTVKSLVEKITGGTVTTRNHGTGSRFYNLNFHSFWRHGTVEFRQHSGTVNSKKTINWIKFCLHFVALAKNDVEILRNDYLGNVMTSLALPDDTKEFFNYRARVLATA